MKFNWLVCLHIFIRKYGGFLYKTLKKQQWKVIKAFDIIRKILVREIYYKN